MEKKNNTGDHLANERTFLAWMRTSVALMGFGFILVRFSVFLRQLTLLNAERHIYSNKEYSGLAGLILVGTGVVVLFLSYINYRMTQKKITENTPIKNNPLILMITILIMSISIFLIIYFLNSL